MTDKPRTLYSEWKMQRFHRMDFECHHCGHLHIKPLQEVVDLVGWNASVTDVHRRVPCPLCHHTHHNVACAVKTRIRRAQELNPPTLRQTQEAGLTDLNIHCHGCGTCTPIRVEALAEKVGWWARAAELKGRLICQKCGKRGGKITLAGPDVIEKGRRATLLARQAQGVEFPHKKRR